MAEIHIIDYFVIIGLLVVSLLIGVYYAWTGRKGTNEDFLMGGRKMSVLPVVISLIASFMSPINILGYPSEIYSKGSQFWMSIFSLVFSTLVAAEIFLPVYYRLKLTSVNTIPWLGVILFSPSLILMTITGLSVSSCIIISGLCVTIYTSIGGLKAVVWTDVVQFTLMIAGCMAIIIKGTIDVGGLSEVWSRSLQGGRIEFFNFDFNIYMSNNFWMVMIGTLVVYTGSYSTSQMMVQRTCTLSSIRDAKKVLYIALPGFIITSSMVCFSGLVIFANYYKCDPLTSGQISRVDEIVPHFAIEIFKDIPGMSGLFVACVCSASLSTLSSGLNAIAALLWEDVVLKCIPNASTSTAVAITKTIAASVGGVCVIMAFLSSHIGTILEAAFALSGAPLGPIFATFIAGMFVPFVNASGALSGLLVGQFCCFFINIGSLLNKYEKGSLLYSTEECDDKVFLNSSVPFIPLANLTNYNIPNHEPQGMNYIFHMTHFMVPAVGFLISIFTSIVVSLITGCNRDKKINPALLSRHVVKFLNIEIDEDIKKEKIVDGTCKLPLTSM